MTVIPVEEGDVRYLRRSVNDAPGGYTMVGWDGLVPREKLGTGTLTGVEYLRSDGTWVEITGSGTVWSNGSAAPDDGDGLDGEYYFRTNGEVYVKAAGTWGSPLMDLLTASEGAGLITAHSGATDPHGDRAYADGVMTTHTAAGDPHPAYALESALGTASTHAHTDYDLAGAASTAQAAAIAASQPLDSDLTAVAALTPSNDDVLQRKGGVWTNRSIAQLTTDLGLAAGYQPLDSDLTAIAALTTLAFGRSLLTGTDAAAVRSLLSLGTAALSATGDFDAAGAAAAAQAASQPLDSDLTAVAALTPTNDDVMQRKGGAWTNRTIAQLLTDLAAAGTTFQPLDSDLTAVAALTPTNDDFVQRKAGAWANRSVAQVLTDLAVPGTTFQPLDADLTAVAALTTTSYGRSFLALADTTAARTWAGVGWTTLSQTADQTVTNQATLQNSNTLGFVMATTTKYRIRAVIFYDTTAAGDFKWAMSGPSAPTLVRGSVQSCIAGGTPAFTVITTAATGSTTLAGTGTTGGLIQFDLIWHNNANNASFTFQFAQGTQTNDTGAIVRAGSYMEYAIA